MNPRNMMIILRQTSLKIPKKPPTNGSIIVKLHKKSLTPTKCGLKQTGEQNQIANNNHLKLSLKSMNNF